MRSDRSNPIYKLIQLHKNAFTRGSTSLQMKECETEHHGNVVPYFMACLYQNPQASINSINIDGIDYAINWTIPKKIRSHVSIFSDFLTDTDPSKHKSSYHLTLFLTMSQGGSQAKLRVYFRDFNTITCIEMKDQNNNLIPLKRTEYIGILAQDVLDKFLTTMRGLYDITYKTHDDDYNALVKRLAQKSQTALILPYQTAELTEYLSILERIIDLLETRHTLEFKQQDGLLAFFKHLEKNVMGKLDQVERAPVVEIEEVQEEVEAQESSERVSVEAKAIQAKLNTKRKASNHRKLDALKVQLKQLEQNPAMSRYRKIVKEHSLLIDKLPLIEEFEETLDCLIRINQLCQQASDIFIDLLMSKNGDYADMFNDMPALIAMIKNIERKHLVMAINNDRRIAMELLIKRVKNIDLNQRPEGMMSLLEFAYRKKNGYIFNMLLKYGASPNIKCTASKDSEEELTILMRACEDGRADEMVALLEAGATDRIADTQSVTAFGRLFLLPPEKRNIHIVMLFMRHCQSMDVNEICCKVQVLGTTFYATPLIYCCFTGWEEAADLLLEQGANPVVRSTRGSLQSENAGILFCIKAGHVSLLSKLLYFYEHFSEQAHTEAVKLLNMPVCNNLPKEVKAEILKVLGHYRNEDVRHVSGRVEPISPLCKAVRNGGVNETRALLSKGANPNQQLQNRWPLLVWAASRKMNGIFQALASHPDCKLDCVTSEGLFPLFIATSRKQEDMVKLLLDRPGFNPNQNPSNRSTALILAAYYGWTEIFRRLLNHRLTDPNLKGAEGITPLGAAVQMNREDIIDMLLNHSKTNVNLLQNLKSGINVLHLASANGQTNIVNRLLQKPGIDINIQSEKTRETALMLAASEGNLEVVIALLRRRELQIDLKDIDGMAPLIMAVGKNQIEVVRVLRAADPVFKLNVNRANNSGYTALNLAAQYGRPEMVKLLLAVPGINVTAANFKNGLSPLTAAILAEVEQDVVEKIVYMLLEHPEVKRSINQATVTGETPFWIAAQTGNLNIINRMLKDEHLSLNINATNSLNVTPIFKAVQKNHTAATKAMLENGRYPVHVNQKDIDGNAPLHFAIINSNVEIVELLLAYPGIDVNQIDFKGYTPLQLATLKGEKEIVEKLLQHSRILVNDKGRLGITPLFLAANQVMIDNLTCLAIYHILIKAPNVDVFVENTFGRNPASPSISVAELISIIDIPEMSQALRQYHPQANRVGLASSTVASLGLFSMRIEIVEDDTSINYEVGAESNIAHP